MPQNRLERLPARIADLYAKMHEFYKVTERLSKPNLKDHQIATLMDELRDHDNSIARLKDKQITPLLAYMEDASPNLRLERHGFRDNLRSAHDIAESLIQDHTQGIAVRLNGKIDSYRPLTATDLQDVIHRVRYNTIYCLAVLRGIAAHHNVTVDEHSFPMHDVKEVLQMRAHKHIGKHEEPQNGPLHLHVHADPTETHIPAAALFGAIELLVNGKKAVSPAPEARILINFTRINGNRLVEVHDSGIGVTNARATNLTNAANAEQEVTSGFAQHEKIGIGSGKVLREVVRTSRHFTRKPDLNPFEIKPRSNNCDGFFKRRNGATASLRY